MSETRCIEIEVFIIRMIIGLISFIGCVWHVSDVSGIYFSYETDVNVYFERETMVQIPGVTLCMNSSLLVREDYIVKRFPEIYNLTSFKDSKYYVLGQYLHQLTLYEQLFKATYRYSDVFNSCLTMKPLAYENDPNELNDYIRCERISPIREYITYSKKCFFISSQLLFEPTDRYLVDHDITLRDNGFPLYQIKLNNQFLDQTVMFIQSRSTPFLGFIGGQSNGIHLNNSKYDSFTFSYVKTSTQLLEPPYRTICRDYNEIGYKTLSHCIVSCKANYFIAEFNGWHADIPANGEYRLQVQYAPIRLKENKTLDKLMADRCGLACSKMEDCYREYYELNTIGQFERTDEQQMLGIYIYLPNGMNTKYFHSPRLHLIEYICYFASVFSLWFGFSIIAISKALIKAYRYYSCRRVKSVNEVAMISQ